jgi:hypothetical protein
VPAPVTHQRQLHGELHVGQGPVPQLEVEPRRVGRLDPLLLDPLAHPKDLRRPVEGEVLGIREVLGERAEPPPEPLVAGHESGPKERLELPGLGVPLHLASLGYGSLADVQFAVELSLMRHGGRHPEIRTRRTLDAIEKLAAARLMEDSVARELGEAFVFLSDVKNALEVDRRVHAEAVPASVEDQTALARRLGYEEYPRQSFLGDYRRITRRARHAMERVFSEGFEAED